MLEDRVTFARANLSWCITSGSFVNYFACTSRKMTERAQKRWNFDMTGRRGLISNREIKEGEERIKRAATSADACDTRSGLKREGKDDGTGERAVGLTWSSIIKPAPVFMVESHPPYLFVYPFLIPASSLAPSSLYSRHRAIKFGNSIPPAAFTHVHTYVSYPHPDCGSVDVSFARLKSTAFYKRIKVNGEGAPSAIPRKAHPSGFPLPSLPPIWRSHSLLCHVCGSGVLVLTEKRIQVPRSYFCLQSLANLYAILRTT